TRFSSRQRRGDRFKVSHFADHDDVRVLPKHVLERIGERKRVLVDFALLNKCLFVSVEVFDRIFDSDNVTIALIVDHVHHRREGSRLSRARYPRNEDQSLRPACESLADFYRKVQLLKVADRRGNRSKCGGDAAALEVDVNAKTADM